ncbi:MAG: L-threonylcarbamoyladenylate synthase [Nitrospiraceae bacterium]
MLTIPSDLSPYPFDEAAQVISRGGVLAIPTETFYGLGVSVRDEPAIRRVIAIKGRPDGKPILILIADRTQLAGLITNPTPAAEALMNQCWPGPLTLIMGASSSLSPLLTGGTGTIGVRQPSQPALLRLLRHVGPLTGTSANRSGAAPARYAQEVQAMFGSEVDLIFDGGPAAGGEPSTVVHTVGGIRIVRQGAFPRQRIVTSLKRAGFALDR